MTKTTPYPEKILVALYHQRKIERKVLKCELPGIPLHLRDNMPYGNVEEHYRKWYGDIIDQFVAS